MFKRSILVLRPVEENHHPFLMSCTLCSVELHTTEATAGDVCEPSPNYDNQDITYLSNDRVGCSNIRSPSKRSIREGAMEQKDEFGRSH
jgi:hypothetical protein